MVVMAPAMVVTVVAMGDEAAGTVPVMVEGEEVLKDTVQVMAGATVQDMDKGVTVRGPMQATEEVSRRNAA